MGSPERDALTPEEIARIRAVFAETGEVRATARQVGRGEYAVRRYTADLRAARDGQPAPQFPSGTGAWATEGDAPSEPLSDIVREMMEANCSAVPNSSATEPPPDPITTAREALGRQRALKIERELIKDIAGEQSFREYLRLLVRESVEPMPPPTPIALPPPSADASVETTVLILSDWHAYEVVKPERVQGFNEYNADVFGRRARRIFTESLKIKQRMEAGGGWRFPNCVVACNGDFVSGTIHEVERHADAPSVIQAVYGCAHVLACGLRELAAHYEAVEVFCTSGNHGRLPDAKRMQQKDPSRNWDTMIYLIAEAFLRDVPNVKFFIPDSYVLAFQVGSKTFVQYHGHGIKSWNAIPFYGISRWTRNIQALRSRKGENVDVWLLSHFHNDSSMSSPGSKTFVNGSLIGGTEFSVNELGACDAPSQKMLFVSDPIGVNSEWSVFGEVEGEEPAPGYHVRAWERN